MNEKLPQMESKPPIPQKPTVMGKIAKMPTTYKNIHESIFKSYHLLDYVLQMIERGDSKETIFEMVEFMSS